MLTRWIRGGVGLLLLLLAVPLPAQNRVRYPLPTPGIPDSIGVNIHFTDPAPGEMELMAKAGIRWARMDFVWDQIEKERGKYDFSAYDRLLAALKAKQIRPLFILDYGNDLYQQGPPRSPEARAAFARFVTAAVTRFKDNGILWEMWNEPNIAQFWQSGPNVVEYAALAKEVGEAIRKAAPDEWYIGPAVSGMDFGFLEGCFQAGLLEYWDAISVHPYRHTPPETAAPDFARLRALIDRYAPAGKRIPILNGEWGYSELYPGLNLRAQSRYIVRQALSNLANGVAVSIWYDWKDDGNDPKETEHHFGTVYSNLMVKPAYQALQTLTSTLDGFAYNKRLALSDRDDHCLLFLKDQELRLAVWTTSATPHIARIPASEGKFTVVDYLGGRSEATAGKNGLQLMLRDEPQYLIPEGENLLLAVAAAWRPFPAAITTGDLRDMAAALTRLRPEPWPRQEPPLRARYLVENLSRDPAQRIEEWRAEANVTLSPGRVADIPGVPGVEYRHEEGTRLRFTLEIENLGALSQETRAMPRYPLRLIPLPGRGRLLSAQIENPTGQPFDGRVVLVETGESRPVRFARGETQLTVTLERKEPLPPSYVVDYRLEERGVNANPTEGIADPNLEVNRELRNLGRTARRQPWIPVVDTPRLRLKLLEDFAGYMLNAEPPTGKYQVVPDGDAKVGAKLGALIAPPPSGLPYDLPGALRVLYEFQPGWKFLRVVPQQSAPLEGEPAALGMWVYSDGSGDLLRMRFVDAAGQTFQPDAGNLDWKGWRFVVFSLRGDRAGYWGGPKDGVVRYPIRIDTLLLVDSPGGRGGNGEIAFTGVTLFYAEKEAATARAQRAGLAEVGTGANGFRSVEDENGKDT
jgi:hypothetical protein